MTTPSAGRPPASTPLVTCRCPPAASPSRQRVEPLPPAWRLCPPYSPSFSAPHSLPQSASLGPATKRPGSGQENMPAIFSSGRDWGIKVQGAVRNPPAISSCPTMLHHAESGGSAPSARMPRKICPPYFSASRQGSGCRLRSSPDRVMILGSEWGLGEYARQVFLFSAFRIPCVGDRGPNGGKYARLIFFSPYFLLPRDRGSMSSAR
jgi:hypothetical protein